MMRRAVAAALRPVTRRPRSRLLKAGGGMTRCSRRRISAIAAPTPLMPFMRLPLAPPALRVGTTAALSSLYRRRRSARFAHLKIAFTAAAARKPMASISIRFLARRLRMLGCREYIRLRRASPSFTRRHGPGARGRPFDVDEAPPMPYTSPNSGDVVLISSRDYLANSDFIRAPSQCRPSLQPDEKRHRAGDARLFLALSASPLRVAAASPF